MNMTSHEADTAPLAGAKTLGGGRYRLGELLAEEDLTVVFNGFDLHRNDWCALRVLRAERADDLELRERFRLAASATLPLDHRHILKTIAVGDPSVPPFQVMESVQGGTLHAALVARGPMHPRLAVDVGIQICKGLAAAHEVGATHGTLSARTVALTRRGVCKVADFGLHRALRGLPAAQPADDVLRLAMTLWTMLLGREPLAASEIDPATLPPDLGEVLARAAAEDPDQRPAVREVGAALQHARKELPPLPSGTPALALRREELHTPGQHDAQRHLAPFLSGRQTLRATLPRADRRGESTPGRSPDGIHAYLVDEDLSVLAVTTQLAPSSVTGEDAQWTTTDTQRRAPSLSLPPFPRSRADMMSQPVLAVGGALVVAGLVFLLLCAMWLRGPRVVAADVEQTRWELTEELRVQQGPLVDDLDALGAQSDATDALLSEARQALLAGGSIDEAERVLDGLAVEAEKLGAGAVNKPTYGRYRSAVRRLQQLQLSVDRHQEAVASWSSLQGSLRLRLADRLGVAPEHPDLTVAPGSRR